MTPRQSCSNNRRTFRSWSSRQAWNRYWWHLPTCEHGYSQRYFYLCIMICKIFSRLESLKSLKHFLQRYKKIHIFLHQPFVCTWLLRQLLSFPQTHTPLYSWTLPATCRLLLLSNSLPHWFDSLEICCLRSGFSDFEQSIVHSKLLHSLFVPCFRESLDSLTRYWFRMSKTRWWLRVLLPDIVLSYLWMRYFWYRTLDYSWHRPDSRRGRALLPFLRLSYLEIEYFPWDRYRIRFVYLSLGELVDNYQF